MNNVPEGAQLSEDGYYWWDSEKETWQPVDGGSASDSSSAGATASTAGEDEDVDIRVEATLGEEPVDVTLDELVAEGFSPDDAEAIA
jgi:hypothetical protein